MSARTLTLAALTLLLSGCGITGNFRHDPGYASFDSLAPLGADREVALSLGPLPIKVARLFIDDEPEIRSLLAELRAVRVYTYELGPRMENVAQAVEELRSALHGDGWFSVVAVSDGDEHTSVLLRPGKNGNNRGLTVIAGEPGELVLVNLIGNVRLDFVDGYMTELGIETPPLEIDAASVQARLSAAEHSGQEQ
jgi:hypothetical protein